MGLLEPWVLCALPSRCFSTLPHCSAASFLHVAAPPFLPHGCFQLLLHIAGPILPPAMPVGQQGISLALEPCLADKVYNLASKGWLSI